MTSLPVLLQKCFLTDISVLLRHWHNVRRVSQLDLALDGDISTRHLGYVETGRAQASREIVLGLCRSVMTSTAKKASSTMVRMAQRNDLSAVAPPATNNLICDFAADRAAFAFSYHTQVCECGVVFQHTHKAGKALGAGGDVGETPLFFTLSGASALLVSAWIVKNHFDAASQASAQAFYWISITLSVAAFIWITLDALGWLSVNSTSNWWFRILIYRAWLVIGTAVGCAVLLILNSSSAPRVAVANNATCTFLTSPYVLKGICLAVSMSFLCTEIGKLTHHADMRQFFLQSGYPSWFLYFIIIAETAGAIGLFVPRTAGVVALSLSGIMIGAIGTHVHNRDPFSDSLEALHLLVLLGCILVIRLQQGKHHEQLMSPPS